MFQDRSERQQYDPQLQQSFQYITPNSRIIPPPTANEYHVSHNDNWKQPVRTSSLKPAHPQYLDRESLIDPTSTNSYDYQGYARETYIEPEISHIAVEDATENHHHNNNDYSSKEPYIPSLSPVPNMNYFHNQQHQQHHNSQNNTTHDFEIRTMNQPKSVKSNVQYIVEEEYPIQVQQAYLDTPQPSVAVYDYYQPSNDSNFSLQPVPFNKKVNNSTCPAPTASKSTTTSSSNNHTNTNNSRLPKPPLTPLVIPPTPVRSSSSPNRAFMTPTRTSSIQNLHNSDYHSPASATTPGSSRSLNSPNSSGLSPFTASPCTPSPNTLLPHNMLPSPLGGNYIQQLQPPQQQQNSTSGSNSKHKKHSFMPDSAAEKCVHEGIKFHEAGKLEQATEMFRQASNMDFPMGMFLYGVSLRHGWGCKKNEHLAFQYLQKSAEHAVVDLNNFSSPVNTSASKGELIMAIYELGVSFRHGWGCKKNKETAVHYFKIAADLNDPDAQNDLGHCYYHGHGVKKDMYLAAKYYRKADKQGQGIMGNSWIWKSKYDNPPSSH